MCNILGEITLSVADLTASIDPKHLSHDSEEVGFDDLSKDGVQELLDRVGGCPACVLAVIRQRDLSAPDFDYKKERELFWDWVNEAQSTNGNYDY